MKRTVLFSLVISMMLFPVLVYAQNSGIADLEATIIQEDYKKANDLAKDLLKTRLSSGDFTQVEYF